MTELTQRSKVARRRVAVPGRLSAWIGFALALAGLSLLLNLPNWPPFFLGAEHLRLSWEAVALLGGAAAAAEAGLPAAWRRRLFRPLAIGIVLLLTILRLADLTANMALGRPVNLTLDLPLLPALLEVLLGAAPPATRLLAVAAALAGLGMLAALVAGALWVAERFLEVPERRRAFLAGALVLGALAASGWANPFSPPGWSAAALAAGQVGMASQVAGERAALAAALAEDRWEGASGPGLLARLGKRDVYVVFIESYGVSALDDPRFRPLVAPVLDGAGRRLGAGGWTARSGLLRSPVRGGRSWLAHGTLLGGIRLPEQAHYAAVLTAGRTSLAHLFARAGHRTVAVMPAMRKPWPEGAVWGFQDVWDADRIGYAGPSFGWSTMPDQFVLAALGRLPPGPRFVQVVLTSSHGAWERVPRLIEDWGDLGDGALYHGQEPADPPWPALDGQYAGAVVYSLSAVFAWLDRLPADDESLVMVLGDHQPAPLVTGPEASDAVPIHVLSRDPELVDAFADWGFARGLWPGDAPPLPMEAFRDRFADRFSAPAD